MKEHILPIEEKELIKAKIEELRKMIRLSFAKNDIPAEAIKLTINLNKENSFQFYTEEEL